MRICIPTATEHGLSAPIAGHLGRAPYLTLIDTDTGACEVLRKDPHAPHTCAPVDLLIGRVEAVVCGGAGRGAVAKLRAAGIPVLVTAATRVDGAVQAVQASTLQPLSVADACGGHHGGDRAGGCRNRNRNHS